MSKALLEPGAKGDVIISSGVNKGRYPVAVEGTTDDGDTIFEHPIKKGALLPTYRDMEFTFAMDVGGAMYEFDMSVIRSGSSGGLPCLYAVVHGEPRRLQRRHFLRMPCSWDIQIFPLEWEHREPMSVSWLPAKAVDVSLRGVKFRMTDDAAGDVSFAQGDGLMMRFLLSGSTYFLSGAATRVAHDGGIWEVGIGFESVALSIEKKIFEFIRQQEIMGREER